MAGRLDINPLMPRHRIEHEPRHRARHADRRVPFNAVSSRPPSHAKPSTGPGQRGKASGGVGAGNAVSSRPPSHAKPSGPGQRGKASGGVGADAADSSRPPSHAKPSTGPGQLGKAFEAIGSGASDRLQAAGTRLRRDQRVLLTGAVRGLTVSPWFAAGVGFVIAAGAFIYAPHASLSFGNEVIGRTPCSEAGCIIAQQAPQITGGANGLVTPSPSASSSGGTGCHAGSDGELGFTYTVQPHGSGMFQMTITVTSDHPIGAWQLSFEIPGATDLSVEGASWRASGTDGGTASGPGDAPSQSAVGQQADVVSFVVDGKGQLAVAPDHCYFNGSSCQFSL